MKHFKRFLMGLVILGIITLLAVAALCFLGMWVVLLPAIIIIMLGVMIYDVGEGIIG
jgi:hypothetical protein